MRRPPTYISTSVSYRMLATPMVLRRSAIMTLWAFLILFLAVLFTPWQQTAMGDGRVIAFAPGDRVQMITATVEGRVEKWFVREGDKVKEGDVLARMTDNDPEIIVRLQNERAALVRQIKALEFNVGIAGKNRARQKALQAEGIASDLDAERAQAAEANAQKDLADAEGKLAKLDTQIARQMTLEIRSPRDGVVQSIMLGENSSLVKSGEILAQLVPQTDERTVELWVEGIDLPFISLGQEVRLQFEGWPILQFAGLPELSVGTFVGEVKIIDPADDGKGRFRLIVTKSEGAIWPSPRILRQGVRARGWVQMNQVPLWFEIWRLINNLPPFTPPLDDQPVTKNGKNGSKSAKNGDVK